MSYSYIENDDVHSFLIISTQNPNLLDLSQSEFENRLQNLLMQRTNLLNPLNQNVNPSIINEIPSNEILKFCGDYNENKIKLDQVSELINIINSNKNNINNAYKNIIEGLQVIFEFVKTNETYRNLYKDLIVNIDELVKASLDSSSKNENTLLDEQTKISNYISECIQLFGIVDKEINKNKKNSEEKVSITCPVCYEKNVNSVFIPCGHTICNICSNKVLSNSCIICRKKAKVIPFFLS
jgi:hypothetical protein